MEKGDGGGGGGGEVGGGPSLTGMLGGKSGATDFGRSAFKKCDVASFCHRHFLMLLSVFVNVCHLFCHRRRATSVRFVFFVLVVCR